MSSFPRRDARRPPCFFGFSDLNAAPKSMPAFAVASNLFTGDGLIIFLTLVLLFGARRFPGLAKGLVSALREHSKRRGERQSRRTRLFCFRRFPLFSPP